MRIRSDIEDKKHRRTAATIGFFDGVHRGHAYLLSQVKEEALRRNCDTTVVTFAVHPREVVDAAFVPELLTTNVEKMELLEKEGVDECVVLPFDREMAKLSAKEFITLLKKKAGVEVLIVGYDHRFGHNREEGFSEYREYGRQCGMEVVEARPFSMEEDGRKISSSAIRRSLAKGEVESANRMLGYDYFIEGTVVEGFQKGREMGFPTANVEVEEKRKLIPSEGVYAVKVELPGDEGGRETYGGMLCIGSRPTMNNGTHRSIEVNIFNFHRNIYGEKIRIRFIKFMRAGEKYPSVAQLVEQLKRDETEARHILSEH